MLWGLGALGRLGLLSIWRLVVKRKCSNGAQRSESNWDSRNKVQSDEGTIKVEADRE
jgi:hypothetical protein